VSVRSFSIRHGCSQVGLVCTCAWGHRVGPADDNNSARRKEPPGPFLPSCVTTKTVIIVLTWPLPLGIVSDFCFFIILISK
jgi:hypothetical protein